MTSDDPCDKIAINIDALFKTMAPDLTPDCCIYRVAKKFHKLNDEAYTPRVISIGPFHRGKPEMQFMERQKERFLFQFINRTKLSLKSLVNFVKDSEERIRQCYAEIIELQYEDFVKMILLDGSFIIEYFINNWRVSKGQSDIILFNQHLEDDMCTDLVLLENQLPYWFLEKLYNLSPSINPDNTNIPFTELACDYFSDLNNRKISPHYDILHFTDLIRSFNLPSVPIPSVPRVKPTLDKNNRKDFSCSATELHAAGVKFKTSNSKCIFDIQFTVDGVLSFPRFQIHDGTESLYRNLMALEQYHYPWHTYICDYIVLMNTLIDTNKDVMLLVKEGIVNNLLGDQDALATLINNLDSEIIHSARDSYFCKLGEDLMDYYEKPWHKWKSNLKQDYFSTPWKTASTVAAVILLMLTFIQTVKAFC